MPIIEHVMPNKKDLPLLLNGHLCRTCADFGATGNIISADFANRSGIHFELDDNCQPFELPTFKTKVWPIGRAWIRCQFPDEPWTAGVYEFFVFEIFVYDAIMGRKFLRDTETLDKYRYRLHDKPPHVHDVPIVAFMGGEEETLRFWLDGEELESTPDTGSEVNVMSWDFARRRGFSIAKDRFTHVRFANGSFQSIIGKVTIPVSFGNGIPTQMLLKLVDPISGCARPSPQIMCGADGEVNYGKTASILADFYILEGLNVEIILGEDILATVNAFVRHHADFKQVALSTNESRSLAPIGLMTRIERKFYEFIGQTKRRSEDTMLQQEDIADSRELDRFDEERRRIQTLAGPEKEYAEIMNNGKRREYERSKAT